MAWGQNVAGRLLSVLQVIKLGFVGTNRQQSGTYISPLMTVKSTRTYFWSSIPLAEKNNFTLSN